MTGGRHLAERAIVTSGAAAEEFQARALAAGHEGVMAKDLASTYEPGGRGKRWFKLKAAETVDCVIVAADRGSGRRRGWLSNYHLAVRDGDAFADVGKTFKGFTDRQFAEMTERLWALATSDDGYTVRVRPEVVVEVAYNEIQKSPTYPSGTGAPLRPHHARPRRQGARPGHDARRAARALRAAVRDQGPGGVDSTLVTPRVSTGLARLDAMLGGGLLPGTLTVVYGATGIGKTHLGLTFADHGRVADGARGVVLDLNGRGDSQQHDEYAARLFALVAHAVDAHGDADDRSVPAARPDGRVLLQRAARGWAGSATSRCRHRTAAGSSTGTGRPPTTTRSTRCGRSSTSTARRARGASWSTASSRWTRRPTRSSSSSSTSSIARPSTADAETLGMEICLPVWKHREFIDAHLYDHTALTTLLLVTTEETRLEDLLARKVATGDIGATANTIVVLGSERVGNRLARMLCVVKHRGSAMSDEIVEYRIGAGGLEFV